jgi:hypothetical protein
MSVDTPDKGKRSHSFSTSAPTSQTPWVRTLLRGHKPAICFISDSFIPRVVLAGVDANFDVTSGIADQTGRVSVDRGQIERFLYLLAGQS